MKVTRLLLAAIILFIGVPRVVEAHLTRSHTADIIPLILSPISAVFAKPETVYTEDPITVGNGPLTYVWTKTQLIPCGEFTPLGNEATWFHPDEAGGGNCPDEPVHSAEIRVYVTDGYWECVAVYANGSAPGIGEPVERCRATGPDAHATETAIANLTDTAIANLTATANAHATQTANANASATANANASATANAKATASAIAQATANANATATAEAKKTYALIAKWVKRVGGGLSFVGGGIVLFGGALDISVIGLPAGVTFNVVGGVVTLVGGGVLLVGEEFSNAAADPPDMNFRRAPNAAAQYKAPSVKGLPPKLGSALQGLLANYALEAANFSDALTAINRASGASQANVPSCVAFQYQAALSAAMRVDDAQLARAKAVRATLDALSAAGVHKFALPAGAVRSALLQIRTHGFTRKVDALFRTAYGPVMSGAVESQITLANRTYSVPASGKVDIIAILKTLPSEPYAPFAPFVQSLPAASVQADPKACASSH